MEYVETYNDYAIRYSECYGVLDNKVIYINEFSEDENRNILMYYSVLKKQEKYNISPELSFHTFILKNCDSIIIEDYNSPIFSLPKLGFINSNFSCYYYTRVHKKSSPTRYRRGFRLDSVDIVDLSYLEVSALSPKSIYIEYEKSKIRVLNNLFFPEFYPYNEAILSILNGKRLSVALSSTIAIKADFYKNAIILYKNLWEIGVFDYKESAFKINTDIFNEDIQSLNIPVIL